MNVNGRYMYGYMYLDLDGNSYFDFEHSSWWNYSLQYSRNITKPDNYVAPFLVGDGQLIICGSNIELWCDASADKIEYNNDTGKCDIYCVNSDIPDDCRTSA